MTRTVEDFSDRLLACSDCERDFVWTSGEQWFWEMKGFATPPKRCPSCRALAKSRRKLATGDTR